MSLSVDLRDSIESDIERIAANMRSDDVNEIYASHRSNPVRALTSGLRSRKCWTALVDGEPAVMFGVADKCLLTSVGTPWLLATDELGLIKKQFLAYSKEYIIKACEGYSRLENFVHVENKLSIRWLRWLGFELAEIVSFNNEEFWRFEMRIK